MSVPYTGHGIKRASKNKLQIVVLPETEFELNQFKSFNSLVTYDDKVRQLDPKEPEQFEWFDEYYQ